jgi:hypothetical protein
VVALAVPFVVSREVNAQLKTEVEIQGSGPAPQAQPIWYAPAELTATASPGVSPVTLTESRSRPSKGVISVTVSVMVIPARLTVGQPATGSGVGVGFGVDVGDAVGPGDAVGVAAAVGRAVEVGVVMGGVAAPDPHPASSAKMVRPTSTQLVR